MIPGIGAVIPAFHEEARIGEVVSAAAAFIDPSLIVVVDDGSADGTARVAASAGARVVRHETNRGKGAALRTGFGVFTAGTAARAVLTVDADGQHDLSLVPRFVEAMDEGGLDIVIGSRMDETTGMPAIRRLTNRVTSAVVSARAGARIPDSQSGYRLVSVDLLRRIDLVTSHFETESELLIKGARAGASIGSIPIPTIYGTERSKIRPGRDTWRFLVLVVRSLFW